MKRQHESSNGKATTKKQKLTTFGPLFTLVGLCLFLVANFAYDAWTQTSDGSGSEANLLSEIPRRAYNSRTANSSSSVTCPVQWTTEPKYSHVNGFCSKFPADKTASYLWNINMEQILDLSLNIDDGADSSADKEWMRDVLQTVLRPVRLRDGLRSLPMASAWGRVMERLHEKLQHPSTAPPVRIVVFGGSTLQGVGSCFLPSFMTKAQSSQSQSPPQSSESLDCAWPHRLQKLVDRVVGPGVVHVTVVSIPTATTELFTAMVQDGRVLSQNGGGDDGTNAQKIHSADLILHAAGSQDNFKFDRDHKAMENVHYQEHQRRVQQDFIRAALHSQPCRDTGTRHAQPAVVYLDDYMLGGGQGAEQGHDSMLADSVTQRAILQLTDYYTAVGLVSYASVVNRLVMADTDKSVFGSGGTGVGGSGSLNYGKVAHVGVLWTLLFAALDFTVDYCSTVSAAKSSQPPNPSEDPLISEDLVARINTVPPPYLDGNTSLVTVSQQWKQEEEKMWERRKAVCGEKKDVNVNVLPPSCVLAVTSSSGAGGHKTGTSLQDYFKPAVYQNESVGWELLPETGTLHATRAEASLKLEMVVPENHQSITHVQVFVVREDFHDKTKSTAVLQVKVQSGHDDEKSVEVEAIHNNAVRVALPVRIEVQPPAAAGTLVQLELRLIKGESVDVEGVFVC